MRTNTMDTYVTDTNRIETYDPTLYEELVSPPSPTGMQSVLPPIVFWAGMVLCVIMGGLVALSGNKAALAYIPGLFCLASMLVAPQISLYVFMAWQAWDGILLKEEGAVMTPAKILAFVAILVCFVHVVFGRGKPASRPAMTVLFVTLAYFLYSVATAPAALAKLAAFRYAGQILILVILVFFGLRVIDNLQRVRAILVWLIAGTFVASLVLLRYGESSQYGRATLGEYVNPNTTAMAIGLAFAAIPALWLLSEGKWIYKGLCILSAVVFAAGMIKTGSRSALIGALMAVGIGVLITSRQNTGKKILVLVLIGGMFVITMFIALQSGMLSEKTQLRFESMLGMTDESVVQQSRAYVWKESLGAWLRQQPVLGVGLGNTAMARQQQYGTFQDVHSSLIGPFVEGGLIGGILFWSLLVYLFFRVWERRRSALGMPLLVMYFYLILSCVAHTVHFTKWFWIPVFLIVMLLEWIPEDRQVAAQEAAMAEYQQASMEADEAMAPEESPDDRG